MIFSVSVTTDIIRYNMLMVESWFFLQSPPADAATNMATDEALLRGAAERGCPLLRVYAWRRPAVSIGYFQKFPAELVGKYEIVRRPTGGGLVYHGKDTTYTVIAPPAYRLYSMPVADGYSLIHRAVMLALQSRAVTSELKSRPDRWDSPRGDYECFQNPVCGDVVAGGRKLAGAAQRRTKWGLLHQGSIAMRLSVEDLLSGFCNQFAADFRAYELKAEEKQLAAALAREKYATRAWNVRHG
jgi:lipoate-protein ligase A